MTFKESLERDIEVFINPEEFGEPVEIDGVKLLAVIIRHSGKRQRADIAQRTQTGIYLHPDLHSIQLIGDFMTVYFRSSEYMKERGRLPKHTEFVMVNGKRYKVEMAAENHGLVRLDCAVDSMNAPNPKVAGWYE